MDREYASPRDGWKKKLEDVGFTFHSVDGIYWDESVCYRFTEAEIDEIESATSELHSLCLKAVAHVVEKNRWNEMGIPASHRDFIRDSWERRDPSLYGRFDLCVRPGEKPKMLEYNADTPTSLVEASLAQWFWLEESRSDSDQFNSIHEKLLARWEEIAKKRPGYTLFGSVADNEEDFRTVEYLRDVAVQAGIETAHVSVEDLGWDEESRVFVDLEGRAASNVFKLYPWEWMFKEAFADRLLENTCNWIEPPWKALLSDKAILPILWELFPNHPNLLPAFFKADPLGGRYARKPFFSREGANVQLVGENVEVTPGPYGEEGHVFQALAPLPVFAGKFHAVVGSWVIGDEPAGIGVREDEGPVTQNTSHFIPHYFDADR